MSRYFIVHSDALPDGVASLGNWHFIELGSHGDAGADHHAVCLLDAHVEAPAAWLALPRITDAKTPISDRIPADVLADIGLSGAETTAEAVDTFERLHPLFRH